MYDNTENAFSQKRVVPNGERTFIAPADICGYSFANEIQNSVKVILVWIVIFNRGHLTGHPMLQSNLMTDGGYLILLRSGLWSRSRGVGVGRIFNLRSRSRRKF